MRAIDTNVLVLLLVQDDAKQVAAAKAFIQRGAWVSHVVLCETAWVLASVYSVDAKRLAGVIGGLLEHESLTIENRDTVAAALVHFRKRPALGFSDCLIYESALASGHRPMGTFDRALAKLEHAEKL